MRGESSQPLRGESSQPLRGESSQPLRGEARQSLRGEGNEPLRGQEMMNAAVKQRFIRGAMLIAVVMAGGSAGPSWAVNPCAPNPCAAKPLNPCAAKAAGIPGVRRPMGSKLAPGDHKQLAKQGEALFKDTKLSTNGMACQSCHGDLEAFQASFAKPYPHRVEMADSQAGLGAVSLDEMVQLCMIVPMEAKPLPWDSKELAALTAYAEDLQKMFMSRAANPCAAKPANPCTAKPGNPCAVKK